MGFESAISPVIIPSVECLKIFVVKILKIEQNPQKPQNFHTSKLIRYTVLYQIFITAYNLIKSL